MKKIIFGIYDAVAAEYTFLGFRESENLLIRDLDNIVNSGDKNSVLVTAAKDHSVYLLGYVDTTTGVIEPVNKKLIVELMDLKHEQKN